MENSVATIQCSNPSCQAPNLLTDRDCHKCRTPIVRRYLWTVGQWERDFREGELIGDRYLFIRPRILLDTQPAIPPITPEEVPDNMLPYLKLLPYRLHVPLVYGYLPSPDEQLELEIWLLEYNSVPTDESGKLKYDELFPKLTEVWQKATGLRQLNWLWQMARLWEPLQNRGVAASLLAPSLLRVNGPLIQLLELQFDQEKQPSLHQLGQLWLSWIEQASPNLTEFLQKLCEHLEQGKIERAEQLVALLEKAIEQAARLQERTYQIYTCTDAGPTRDHNEDACYPPSGKTVTIGDRNRALAIVCDGIGGQEGGEIASQLAIDTLVEDIDRSLGDATESDPKIYMQAIERAICDTNDLISDRNDSENRQERQRMGTTLVMSLARAHEIYIAHVGDSRIYWITPTSCHQVTVDDDLASREVRLGYLLYREAVQYPNAGALVQALGMSSSASLHPTVQHLILDEDCVFLLCSDGLSDFDRVEQYWEKEIAPILEGKRDVMEAGKRLLALANQRNGHDNVTIALVHCQVQPKAGAESTPLVYPEFEAKSIDEPPLPESENLEADEEAEDTVLTARFEAFSSPETPPQRSPWLLVLAMASLGLLALGGGYWLWQLANSGTEDTRVPIVTSDPQVTPIVPEPTVSSQLPLAAGDAIEIFRTITLLDSPAAEKRVGDVPKDSMLKVVQTEPNSTWLKLQVCQVDEKATSHSIGGETSSPLGKEGWIKLETLKELGFRAISPAADNCLATDSSDPTEMPSPPPSQPEQLPR
ncbi:MAG: protein phosphatase 2C domain-containing protein [Hydrococcus sp. C42_A2020_068]|nr:protein phosphatase 2C domain-containing protein [Hydrococcus sp. C42_A2020_068]